MTSDSHALIQPGPCAGLLHARAEVSAVALLLSQRERLHEKAARLAHERDDLPPNGPAYEAKSLELDVVLSAIFALGPVEV